MSDAADRVRALRTRREPPRFRPVELRRAEDLSPRLRRVVLGGEALAGLTVDEPAASVRLLLPAADDDGLVLPEWNGNEFLRPDGSRPAIRTFTPRRFDPDAHELTLDVVLHGGGVAGTWAASAGPGAPAAISGPGRGYEVDEDAGAFVLAGDETALPAISQLLETIPPSAAVDVLVEVADPSGRVDLPGHAGASVRFVHLPPGAPPGDALVAAVEQAEIPDGAPVWVAGEAAAVQRIRRHLFDDRGLTRQQATVRGYWKHGRDGD